MREGDCSGIWMGEGLKREVFFFESRGVHLYGSLYAAAKISRPVGVVACNSWGVEADRADPLQRSVALAMARQGGAGFVFHYPGHGDSYGESRDLDLAALTEAARDAVAEASRRCPGVEWILAGFMLGASIACLAQQPAGVRTLLLVQPALRPGSYFQGLRRRTRSLAPGPSPREMREVGTDQWMAYGYPIPRRIAERASEADAAVHAALTVFDGDGAIVRQEKPAAGSVPGRFEVVEASGTWRFGARDNAGLGEAAEGWLASLDAGGN